MLLRLLGALALGAAVAFVYRRTRHAGDVSPSFTTTLVLLAVLIAMVTQVIGDNVARAFSLVGALSIVRFRTVVRDTQDTAYVIFAVAVGMAIGASDIWVALCGLFVVGLAAVLLRPGRGAGTADATFLLQIRVSLGHDVEALLGLALDQHVLGRRLASIATARQGMAIEASYKAALRGERSADELLRALNRIEGVQGVSLQRLDAPQSGD